MRCLFCLLFFAVAALLASCTQAPRPVRLDFIGSSRFTSSSRTVGFADTLSTRLYASGDSVNKVPLMHFVVAVTYDPTSNPVVYASPAVTLPSQLADPKLIWLDSTLSVAAAKQFVYQTGFGARTTSGRERWEFTVEDGTNSATRTFQLQVRRPDSLADFHQYTLRIPTAPAQPPRPFVALRPGLAFPASMLRASGAPGRQLIDLEYRPGATSLSVYHNPDQPARSAQLRVTDLDSAAFTRLTTPGQIADLVGPRLPASPVLATGQLARNTVVAFRTVDNHAGVFRVSRLAQTPYPVLEIQVRVVKTPG